MQSIEWKTFVNELVYVPFELLHMLRVHAEEQ